MLSMISVAVFTDLWDLCINLFVILDLTHCFVLFMVVFLVTEGVSQRYLSDHYQIFLPKFP